MDVKYKNDYNNNMKRIKSSENLNNNKENKNSYDDPILATPQRISSMVSDVSTHLQVSPKGSSLIGRASSSGLEKVANVLDTFGSVMTNLNNRGFLTGKVTKGNKPYILSFEVTNTITRGIDIMQSLSEENVKYIKAEVLSSEGVQCLVSLNTEVLLSLVASDKREELDVFCKGVIRFGNFCDDAQFHNLNWFFQRLKVEGVMLPCKERLMMLNSELRQQKKILMTLKKKSLWMKKLEEIMEKLVDVVTFTYQDITNEFGAGGHTLQCSCGVLRGEVFSRKCRRMTKNIRQLQTGKEAGVATQRLGPAGLALHYANIIIQINNIASRPDSLSFSTRDALYCGLPDSVKTTLRSILQTICSNKELEVPQIKAEMEKILQWLVPMASNTIKAHQDFGYVGEWANASNKSNKEETGSGTFIRLQTLYHADKEKMDRYILTLILLLHQLIKATKVEMMDSRNYP